MPSGAFGTLLRRYRVAAGLSQEQLAERAGISLRGLSDLERGLSRAPRLHTLTLLGTALGLDEPARRALSIASGYTLAEDQAPAPLPVAPRHDQRELPGFLTRLLGRETERAAAADLLSRPDVRLLTLIGPGGVGKTRLAVQIAADRRVHYADGVGFVPLAPLRDQALIPTAIAQALGLDEAGDQGPRDSILRALAARELLIVLDNVEHVLDGATFASELLMHCPRVQVLATSRTALRLRGEHTYAVSPLVVPEHHAASTPEAASTWPAVALFVQRAQAVQSAFVLDPDNLDAVVSICRRLDGLPLALELAAARLAVLPPAALLARLDQRLPLLTGGPRDAPARHRALRDAIAWSYDLLGPAEQRLFQSLGVFAGGWTLDMAQATRGDVDPDTTILDGMSTLVAHSLVQPVGDATGEPRFVFLETIREHALELLESSGEAAAVRRRHAQACLRLAEAAEPHLLGAARAAWLRRLDQELDNVRVALNWSISEGGDPEPGRCLVGSLRWFWYLRGHLQEGRRWAEQLLRATPADALSSGHARALLAAGGTAIMLGDAEVASERLEAAARVLRTLGDARLTHALSLWGLALASLGEVRLALQVYGECVALSREAGDAWLEAYALTNQGAATELVGDQAGAEALYRNSLALFASVGDDWGRSIALRGLGGLALAAGDVRSARSLYEQSVPLFRETGDRRGLPQVLLSLGRAALRDGDPAYAQRVLIEAITRWQELGIAGGTVRCLAVLASACAARGEFARAATLYAAVESLARGSAVSFSKSDEHERTHAVADIRQALGDDAFESAWSEGSAMTLDQAVALAS